MTTPQRVPRSTPRSDTPPSKQPTTQDTPPTVTTPQRVPRSTPRSDTPPSEPAPIRTITEGQSTTFAPPVPADRQNIRECVTSIPGNSKTFFAEGGCYRRSNGDVEYRHYFSSVHSSTMVFGVCSGPYTLEVITRDSRVQTSGNQIRVTTTPSGQDTDDAGTVQVAYLLHGTRTVTHVRFVGLVEQITTFDTASCALTPDPVTVEVRRGIRPAMTAAVAVHAPSTEYLSTPSTVTWECTQVLVDAGVQCALNSVISTTTQPTFPTPRGCRIVVTVSENRPGHGSTNCLTSDGIAAHEDTINNGEPEDEWLDVDSLPPCPLSTAPADLEALDLDSSGRKRCVATRRRWGLLPWFAKDRKMAAGAINARVETVNEKATFRDSFERRRCLIPADGFYEWERKAKGKLPHYIYATDGSPLALAGLWASWADPETGERMRTCTIITGRPNDLVARLHDRMPVAIPPGLWDRWLDVAVLAGHRKGGCGAHAGIVGED